jgi:hypothetical protein
MSDPGTSGTVLGFDATFSGAILPQSLTGQLLAVLVVSPALNNGDTDVAVTISDFVVSGNYNGQDVGLGACDTDLDPFNGCFSTSSFTTVSAQAGLSLSNVTSSSADLLYGSNIAISGFQLNVAGVTLTGASSGLAETSFSSASGNVVGFDLSGASLAPGGGLLVHLDFEETSPMLGVEPVDVSSKSRWTRRPPPGASEAPDRSKPTTLPLAELNDVSANPLDAPVRVTPATFSWKPDIAMLLPYRRSAELDVTFDSDNPA